jgi:hypothetical protein
MSKEDFIKLVRDEVNKEFSRETYFIDVEDLAFLCVVAVKIVIYSDFNSAYSILQQLPYELKDKDNKISDIRLVLKAMHEKADDYINKNSDWDLSLKQYL